MDILTDKAKEMFLEWYNEPETYFYRLNKTCQNALIMEWFDSVGIYVNTQIMQTPVSHKVYFEYLISSDRTKVSDFYTTRQEATTEALIKANEIYNVRYSKQK